MDTHSYGPSQPPAFFSVRFKSGKITSSISSQGRLRANFSNRWSELILIITSPPSMSFVNPSTSKLIAHSGHRIVFCFGTSLLAPPLIYIKFHHQMDKCFSAYAVLIGGYYSASSGLNKNSCCTEKRPVPPCQAFSHGS